MPINYGCVQAHACNLQEIICLKRLGAYFMSKGSVVLAPGFVTFTIVPRSWLANFLGICQREVKCFSIFYQEKADN